VGRVYLSRVQCAATARVIDVHRLRLLLRARARLRSHVGLVDYQRAQRPFSFSRAVFAFGVSALAVGVRAAALSTKTVCSRQRATCDRRSAADPTPLRVQRSTAKWAHATSSSQSARRPYREGHVNDGGQRTQGTRDTRGRTRLLRVVRLRSRQAAHGSGQWQCPMASADR
jgi:hypothetical protein